MTPIPNGRAMGVFGDLLGDNTMIYREYTVFLWLWDILVHQYFYKLHLTVYLRAFKPHYLIGVVLNHCFNVFKI